MAGKIKKTNKISIVIVGGAFNPPTNGHVALAKFILDTSKTFDEVWFSPCGKQHMYNKDMVSPEHRVEMCKLAIKCDGRIKVFPYEIENGLSGETYNFVKRLQDDPLYKDTCDFSIAIGMDNANTFDKWVNYQDLEKMIRFVVVSRQGVNINDKVDWYRKPPHIFLQAENEIPMVSSTIIRTTLADNTLLSFAKSEAFMPKEVLEYIKKHRLYQEDQT